MIKHNLDLARQRLEPFAIHPTLQLSLSPFINSESVYFSSRPSPSCPQSPLKCIAFSRGISSRQRSHKSGNISSLPDDPPLFIRRTCLYHVTFTSGILSQILIDSRLGHMFLLEMPSSHYYLRVTLSIWRTILIPPFLE